LEDKTTFLVFVDKD